MTEPIIINDAWTGDDGDPWDPTIWPLIRDVYTPGIPSPTPTIQGNVGHLETGSGERLLVCFTAPTMKNFQMDIVMQNPSDAFGPPYTEFGYRIYENVESSLPHGYRLWIWHDTNAVYLWDITNNTGIGSAGGDFIDNDAHHVRLRVKELRHQVKWWKVDEDEPLGWNIDVIDGTYPDPGRSYLGLGSNGIDATVALYDDFTLTEILPPDPGINVGGGLDEIVALYVGAEPVIAAYQGNVPYVVP